jgi:hypothetical protein
MVNVTELNSGTWFSLPSLATNPKEMQKAQKETPRGAEGLQGGSRGCMAVPPPGLESPPLHLPAKWPKLPICFLRGLVPSCNRAKTCVKVA